MNAAPDRLVLRDASIRLDSMPPTGREIRLSVGTEERAALADLLAISALDRLDVSLNAVRFRGGMRVTGRLNAAVSQPSVVSFEPVHQQIDEPIDRVFLPGGDKPHALAADAEIFVDIEGEDVPDHFDGPEADLSGLIVETLSLAIDPYPRAPGESLDTLGVALDDDAELSPFAGLKSLKNTGDKG